MTAAARPRAYLVDWRELPRWDLKSARAAAFRAAHPSFQRLGNFVEEAAEIVHAAREPAHEWPVYGVNNKEGVSFSHFQKGAAFNAPYKQIREDWFFHNPTRANVGSLGRVPHVPPDALTSPEYQVWRIKRGLLPDYLEILIRLPFFLDLIECHRVGAVKERLFVENLCEIPIPLFEEKTQRAIVVRWREAHEKGAAARGRVEAKKAEIDARFFSDLGLNASARTTLPKCFAVLWKDFLRWGVSYNQQRQTGLDITQGKFPVVELGSILDLVQYGTSEKANSTERGTSVLRIGNIKDRALDLSDLKHIELPKTTRESLLLREGDIAIIRTSGSRDLVGTCAVFHGKEDFVFASYLIRLRVATDKAEPEFVSWFINSPLGREQVDAVSRQIMQNNINSEELRGLQIPLPPLRVQREIVARVQTGRAEIARERAAVARLTCEITSEIEALILGETKLEGERKPGSRPRFGH
jgi:type I restriction enzyme S subunit